MNLFLSFILSVVLATISASSSVLDDDVFGEIVTRVLSPLVENLVADDENEPTLRNPFSPSSPIQIDSRRVGYHITEGDYLLGQVARINAIRIGLRDVNGSAESLPDLTRAASLLWVDVNRESSCTTSDCIETRQIIHQGYLRLSRLGPVDITSGSFRMEIEKLQYIYTGLYIGISWVDSVYKSVCFRTADHYTTTSEPETSIATTSSLSEVVVEINTTISPPEESSCWPSCIANCLRRRSVPTTTTTTAVPRTSSAVTLQPQITKEEFIRSSNDDLDTLIFNIGVALALNDPQTTLEMLDQTKAEIARMIHSASRLASPGFNTTTLESIRDREIIDLPEALKIVNDLRPVLRKMYV